MQLIGVGPLRLHFVLDISLLKLTDFTYIIIYLVYFQIIIWLRNCFHFCFYFPYIKNQWVLTVRIAIDKIKSKKTPLLV